MKKFFLVLVTGLVLVLAACGNTENQEDDSKANQNKDESDSTNEQASVTIEDVYDKKTIEGTPKRVVVLEWVYAEDLLALGVEPVGMADIEGYHNWVNIEPKLSDKVKDVGTRQEPNLEAISRLNPDLIITASYRHDAIMEDLESIAPTLAFNPYPEKGQGDQYQEMNSTFNKIAKVMGKEDKAEEVLANMEDTFEESKQKLVDNGFDNTPFVLTQAYSGQNTPTIRLFTDNGMATQIMEKLGLQNAYDETDWELYGYKQTDVEALQNFQNAHFFYIVQEDDNVFENQLSGNPAWENLDFVKNDRLYQLPGDTWTFGGPLSAETFASQITNVMLEKK
ncbi:iron complex transport system substrate-binding protein [Salinibacillus kushneri]|uniref:Iron complex transport system substrate-binding protein n=1 Tax=Salinibacillus kushneri TaxID=237682 RepID=A0A1I0IMK8_9BACI|nr:iron-siderophore ABC transporter substrate-binding protein [Salinibacillus kushneri]SET98258.1 iron complex transport system substrate-binding protein [Salinibacillus kushneri]